MRRAVVPFTLQRLDHVSINVADRARSIAWYRDVLGLEQKSAPAADDAPVFMGEFGACIGIFQAQADAAERSRESVGFRHVAFTVGKEDLSRAEAHIAGAGVSFQLEDHGGSRSLYLRDPDGHTVELTTYEL